MTGLMSGLAYIPQCPAGTVGLPRAPAHGPVIPKLLSSVGETSKSQSADVQHTVSTMRQHHIVSSNNRTTAAQKAESTILASTTFCAGKKINKTTLQDPMRMFDIFTTGRNAQVLLAKENFSHRNPKYLCSSKKTSKVYPQWHYQEDQCGVLELTEQETFWGFGNITPFARRKQTRSCNLHRFQSK